MPEQSSLILHFAADFPAATRAAWRELAARSPEGADPDALASLTADGLRVRPLYTREDRPAEGDASGFPGFAPFTRGARAAPRPRRAAWDIRARHEWADAAAAGAAIAEDLERGVASIELKVGPGGVPVAEIGRALAGAGAAAIALDAGGAFAEAAQALMAFRQAGGVQAHGLRDALNADPLGTLARDGALPDRLEQSLARMAALAKETAALPHVNAIAVDTRPCHNAGATEAQELGAMLATGAEYLRVLSAVGFGIDDALGRIAVTLTADADIFLTLAKVRAARMVWAQMAAACGAGEAAQAPRLHVQTSERMMTRYDPWMNMLRMTAATFAAALGGADGITVLPHTDALGLPDGFARRIARNTQIVLMEESGLGAVTDPAGGAYALECLTEDLARAGWAEFQAIEAQGGMAAALRSGFIRERIDAAWERRAARLATRAEPIIGVSIFPWLEEPAAETAGPRPKAAVTSTGERITALRARRLTQDFEALRAAGLKAGAQVWSVNLGKLSGYGENAAFAKSLLEAGGLAVPEREAAAGPESAAGAVTQAGVRAAVLCGTPELFAAHAVDYACVLKKSGIVWLCLAADPGPHEAASRAAGIDAFLYEGCDALAVLRDAHRALGIGGGRP